MDSAAPEFTQFASTADLRDYATGAKLAINEGLRWKNGARVGPGRSSGTEKHQSPAGPHPEKPKPRDQIRHSRRRSKALAAGDFAEDLELLKDGVLPGTGGPYSSRNGASSRHGDEYSEDDQSDLDDPYDESEVEDEDEDARDEGETEETKYGAVVDRAMEKASEQEDDNQYTVVTHDLKMVPNDPAERKKYFAAKQQDNRTRAKGYVVVGDESDNDEEVQEQAGEEKK